MDSTGLTLLTSDGLLRVTFRPMLTAAQYATFYDVVLASQRRSRDEIRDLLAQHANEWGVAFEAEEIR